MDASGNTVNMEPFGVDWMDSSYQQTLLPNAPWHQMEDKISRHLAQKVEKQFLKPERKEALLQLLGQDFTDKYLQNAKRNPWCLEPPAMGPEEKQKILREAQAYLNSQAYKSAKDAGYQHMLTANPGGNPPGDYASFLQHTYNIFKVGLDRELFKQEQALTKQRKERMNLEKKYLKNQVSRIPAPSRLKPISSGKSTAGSGSSGKPSTAAIKARVQQPEGDPPPLWGVQSDAIGKSVLAILQRDPRKFDHVAGRLHGRQLPGSLRAYMWSDILFKEERKRMKEVVVEKVVRERFAKALTRGMQSLRTSKAHSTPINGLIENAVIETYNKTTSLVPYKTPNHMKEAIRTLNVLYTYDRSYEPYLIYWLFPLQIAFSNGELKDDRGENMIELSMYLDLLNSNCFPSWPIVFAVAEQALTTLKNSDPDFYNHLKMISKINVKVNPKEFLVQLLHEEKAKAETLMQSTPGGAREKEMSSQLLADPLVFIRRWIGEGFVSILDVPSVMYVWDQCFLQSWQQTVIENFCVAILELLRHKFMAARDYMGMKEVFLNEACKLFTIDLQQAWIHLERGKDAADVPFLNRQRPVTAMSRMSRMSLDESNPVEGMLAPCGIKDVKLRMIIPSEVMQREPWLSRVDPNFLKLNAVMYFGEVRLQSHSSIMPSSVISTTQDSYGNTIYEVIYPEDKFIFRDVDISPYDLEREMGAYPYAIVRVQYELAEPGKKDRAQIPVGWARIPLFQRKPVHGATSVTSLDINWEMQLADTSFDLHPGEIPETLIATQPVTPSEHGQPEEGAILGYNSKIMAVVYDPLREPQSKFPPAIPHQTAPSDTRDPSPEPRFVTPRPSPRPSPIPQPRRPTPRRDPSDEPWVRHDPNAARQNPSPTGLKDTIDLYIDSVRFIPDNATLVKVTGRILRTGSVGNVEDILALPDLNSTARSPTFNYRLTINKNKQTADAGMLAFLRVYSVDIVGETIGVIGSCLVPFFDTSKTLRVGGYQYKLHNGMPQFASSAGIAGIKPTDLDNIPVMPGVSMLVRVLPHSEAIAPYPQYSSGYFESAACEPNISEYRIFRSYDENMAYPKTVREMTLRIMETEGQPPHGRTDTELLTWLTNRLDIKRNQTPNRPAENLSLVRAVRYKIKMGVKIEINQIFGMPEGQYIQCFSRVAPGAKVLSMEPTAEGYGGDEKFVTLKHNFDSHQSSQVWVDNETVLHPFYDQYSCLIIQLFGLEVLYHPKPDHEEPGTVTDLKNRQLTLEDDSRHIGWAALPLFEGNSVLNGIHHIPVYKGKPSAEFLQQLTTTPAEQVLNSRNIPPRNKYPAASLRITVYDGHYDLEHVPEMPVYEYLMEVVGKLSEYKKAQGLSQGKTMNNFVIDVLESKYKKQGQNSAIFQKEVAFFKELMERTFYDLMVAGGGGSGSQPNPIQAGRRSVCGEDSQDEFQLESELCRLQRQLHVMEGDRRAYSEDTCNLLRKQQSEIRKLKQESEEMDKILRLARSEKNQSEDHKNTMVLLNLIRQLDNYNNECKEEQRRIKELDSDILSIQEQINEERKLVGGATEEDAEMNITKRLRVTENRLDQELIKFNKQLASNARLREELDHQRQEKAVFDTIHKRLTKQLEDTKWKINSNITQATQAYEERDEAQNKMMALKERSEKDMSQQEIEMKELQRIIKHDNKLKQFMGIKVHDRADLKEEEQSKKKKGKDSGEKDNDVEKEQIKRLEEAFDKIKEATGEYDIDKIVTEFIRKEDINFAMYNYVNELNDTVENILDEIEQMQQEIRRFQDDEVKSEENRKQMIREMEIQCNKFGLEAEDAEKNNTIVCKVLDEIKVGVVKLFKEANCDASTISEMLGSEEGVTNKNILQYMGLIEQRTMDLIQIQQYIEMKKEPPKQDKKDGKGQPTPPASQQSNRVSPRAQVTILAPNSTDDDDLLDEGDLRPLTRNEIKNVVMRTIGTKLSHSNAQRKKSSGKRIKTSTPNSVS